MASLAKLLKDEIDRAVAKELKSMGIAGQLRSLGARLTKIEKRLGSLESSRAVRPASAARGSSRKKVDGRTLRFSPDTLKAIREKLDVTQQEMAKLLGVSGNAVWQWEAGRAKPRAKVLEKMRGLRSVGKREAKRRLDSQ
jgi:DNA-binding transcriptional regulator YiaG